MLSEELESNLNRVYKYASEHRHQHVTVEHLLYGLTFTEAATETLEACGGNVEELRTCLESFIKESVPILPSGNKAETQPTLGFQRVLQRSVFRVQSLGEKEVAATHVLVSLFGEQESKAVYMLHKQNVHRLDVVNYLSHGIEKNVSEEDLDTAFEKGYDEKFDYKNLLRLKDKELKSQKHTNDKLELKIKDSSQLIEALKSEIGELKSTKSENKIIRSINFKPEHRQAGLSILSYFSEIIAQKYPDKTISVSIEQIEKTVRLTIVTADGDKEIIEEALEAYGKVIIGDLSPEKLLANAVYLAQLEHKLELAHVEIRSCERLLKIKDDSILDLKESFQVLVCINKNNQQALDNAIGKIGDNKEVLAVIDLIKSLEKNESLTEKEIDCVEDAIKIVYKESPGAAQEIRDYCISVSSSMVGSVVLNTLRNLGFI